MFVCSIKAALSRSSYLSRNFFKNQWKLNYLIYFSNDFKKYRLSWVGYEKLSPGIYDFQTCARKIEIKVQPIDQMSWIKLRVPEINESNSLQNFRFPSHSSRSKPSRHESSFKPNFEATRKDPDPKKIPGSSFDFLNQCAEFRTEILTLST